MQSNAQDSLNSTNIKDSSGKLKTANPDESLLKVEIESSFPGGNAGWAKFLNANLHYPDKAIRKRIQGEVVVQFIVGKDGSVSDVQAISGPEKGGLREEAVRVVTISGKWIPAFQYGRKVKSYKKQPLVFRLE